MSLTTVQRRVAARIGRLRDQKNVTQEALAAAMGLANRQTVSEIEMSKRPISPDEMARAARFLGVTTASLTDPFDLFGEGRFNFRSSVGATPELAGFQEIAGKWVAMLRVLKNQESTRPAIFSHSLPLSLESSFEAACAAGEAVGQWLGLGTPAALNLESAIQEKLGIHVLYVDAPVGISGAAIHLNDFQVILVSRREPLGRRSYDLAHELFHVLTWDRMPPRLIDPVERAKTKGNRIEMLADNFAASLLMPESEIKERWSARGDRSVPDWISETAAHLRVSGPALGWRLVNLELLSKSAWLQAQPLVQASPRASTSEPSPRLFNAEFVRVVHSAVESGRLSVRRAAGLLQLPLTDLAVLFKSYGHDLSYDFA